MHRRPVAALVVAACLTGCGSTSTSTSTTTTGAVASAEQTAPVPISPRRIVIRETDFALHPAAAVAGKEGLVVIKVVNNGSVPHALAVDGPNGTVELDGRVSPGHKGTLQVDLDRAGTYTMYCPLDGHRAKGMQGTITVGGTQPARGAEQSGTQTTQTQTTQTQTTPTQTVTKTTTRTQTVTTPTSTTQTTTGNGY